MSKSKEYGEQLYDAAVLTAGAVGVSFASRKLTKDTLDKNKSKTTLTIMLKFIQSSILKAVGIHE